MNQKVVEVIIKSLVEKFDPAGVFEKPFTIEGTDDEWKIKFLGSTILESKGKKMDQDNVRSIIILASTFMANYITRITEMIGKANLSETNKEEWIKNIGNK